MAEKLYKIGEAAELLKLKAFVLRFWETEFPQLAPTRTQTGQRMYMEKDLSLLKRIKHLLHERGLTIDGARRHLAEEDHKPRAKKSQASESRAANLFDACNMGSPPRFDRTHADEGSKAAITAPPDHAPDAREPLPFGLSRAETGMLIEELGILRAMLTAGQKTRIQLLTEENE